MGKNITNLLVSTSLLLLSVSCNKPVETDTTEPSSVGMWHYAFPPIPGITTDTLNIWLKINSDDSYSLELIERSDKKLFGSNGTWDAADDSIFLAGNDCVILDTSANPDTLAPLDQANCEKPIALPQPEKIDLWTIQTQSVATLLIAFPIPASVVDLIPGFFPEIPLKKGEN